MTSLDLKPRLTYAGCVMAMGQPVVSLETFLKPLN